MTTSRQVARQIEMFLEDGQRERLTVALAILDGMDATAASSSKDCCSPPERISICHCLEHWHPHRRTTECRPRRAVR